MTTKSVATAIQEAGNANRDRRSLIDLLKAIVSRTIGAIAPINFALNSFKQLAAQSTALGVTPNGTYMGLSATAGTVITGSTTIGSGTASATETIYRLEALPERYTAGEPVTVRVHAKTSALATVSASVNVSAKLVSATDGSLGAELNAASATPQALTIAYADYDFVVAPATLLPGSMLSITITSIRDDTAGALTGANTIAAVSLRPTVAA